MKDDDTATPEEFENPIQASAPPVTGDADQAGRVTNWEGVLNRFVPQLQNLGFSPEEVPSPDDFEAFPSFLAQVQVKDPLLASEISRTVRSFRDQGALPNAGAQAKRQMRRNVKKAATMRQVNGKDVYDKRKAPMYALATLLLLVGPMAYLLSRPTLEPAARNEETTATTNNPDTTVVPENTESSNGNGNAQTTVADGVRAAGRTVTQAGQNAVEAGRSLVNGGQQGEGQSGSATSTPGTNGNNAGNTSSSTSADTEPVLFGGSNSSGGLDTGSTPPPQVSSPPVSTYTPVPAPARTPPAEEVYTPVRSAPAPTFGQTVSTPAPAPAPVASTAPAPAPLSFPAQQTQEFGGSVPSVTLTPAPSGSAGSAGSGTAPVARTTPATATGGSSSASAGSRAAQAAPASQATRTAGNTSTTPARTSTTPSASAGGARTSTTPSVPSSGASQGAAFGNSVTAPLGMVAQAPESVPAENRQPVTSGLVYERRKPDAPAPAAAAPVAAAAPASSAPVIAETGLFGQSTAVDSQGSSGGAVRTAGQSETPFGSDAAVPSSRLGALGPFRNLQQIPVQLVTAIYTLTGGSVPVVVVTPDGGSFVGSATVNGQLARVDMSFRRYVAPDGTVSDVDALAYTLEGKNLVQGVPASITPIAPTLAIDAAQNGASALQAALVAALENKSTAPVVAVGEGATISTNALPPLWQILAGGVGKTFTMPQNTQSITRAAKVNTSTPMTLIVGLGGN